MLLRLHLLLLQLQGLLRLRLLSDAARMDHPFAMTSEFDDFYGHICGLLQLTTPPLTPDDQGVRAFTITHRGTDIFFIERKRDGSDRMSILVRFGAPSRDRADEVLANLMRANYLMLNEGNSFVQHPESHEVFLHTLVWLDRVCVDSVHAQLDKFAESVKRWERDYFLVREGRIAFDALSFAMLA